MEEMSESLDHEIERQRQRVHKLADTVQAHDGKLIELNTLVKSLGEQLDIIKATMVNKDLLNVTVGTIINKVDLKFENVDDKLQGIKEDLEPIKKGIYWTIGLVLAGVIGGVLRLLIKGSI